MNYHHSLDTLLKSATIDLPSPPVLPEDFTERFLSRLASAQRKQLAEQQTWERWIFRGSLAAATAAIVLLACWLPAARDFRAARQAEARTGDAMELLLNLP